MDSPKWIDISMMGTRDGVEQLWLKTKCNDYLVSTKDFMRQGWRGTYAQVDVTPGFVKVWPSDNVPEGCAFAWPEKEKRGIAILEKELEYTKKELEQERKKSEMLYCYIQNRGV